MFRLARVKAMAAYVVKGSVHDVLTVGRAKQSDLCINDRLVSSNHARFSIKGTTLQVMDLDSRNGTEVNGRRLKPFSPCTLQLGDTIDFSGRLTFRVQRTADVGLAVIQVETDETQTPASASPSGILRAHHLPDTPPDLKSERWVALCALSTKLHAIALQQQADAWLQTLCDEGATLLGLSQLQLLRLVDGRPTRVYLQQRACRVRAEAVEDALRNNGKPVGLEMLSSDIDQQDLQETFDAPPTTGAAPQVITLLLGGVHVEGQLWGLLYATNELSNRRRILDEHDLWTCQRLCILAGSALAGVIWHQALAFERPSYLRLQEEAPRLGLVGSSRALAAALEAALDMSDDAAPLFLQADPGTEPHTWAQLLHGLRQRRGHFQRLSLQALQASATPFLDALRAALLGCQDGTLLIEDLDLLQPADAQTLQQAWAQGWFVSTCLVSSALLSPRQLSLQQSASGALIEALTAHVLRIPPLGERLMDLPLVLSRCGPLCDPLKHPKPLSREAVLKLSRVAFPGDMAQVRAELTALFQRTHSRPLSADEALSLWPSDLTARVRPDHAASHTSRMTLKVEAIPQGVSPLLLPPNPSASPEVPLHRLGQCLRRVGFP